MAGNKSGSRPLIIKRVQAGEEHGHHGGAWKVAYADFVTAMMAFFLLMWLLNATTEKQRQGLADYFNPTVIQTRAGGNSGLSDGGNMRDTQVQNETDMSGGLAESNEKAAPDQAFEEMARHIQDQLNGLGAESMQHQNLLRHVVTRLTDEGLVIELSDLSDTPLFRDDTAQPNPQTRELVRIVATVLRPVRNDLAINGHVRAFPEVLAQSPIWPLSDARAHTIRNLLEDDGFHPRRIRRVVAYGDRQSNPGDPMGPRNNRVEIILLR
ncbi:MAG: flagellar motor protein MotB [Paracoccus sp. (in: a-proteobacteria)]|uniref:flagellar motor protein MotB n=1 Tax=Paracoccus sp. TaxID=267 RepID=UPI0026DFEA2B|nr:flagellar motor protein MotB [Paracoccus sp. (in: a-proteobacteria)]MDO5620889.1 flagellar motor protein MotB [Paracoccus sp. (in: a-proteobacteria)]